jgi:hypothetical protein
MILDSDSATNEVDLLDGEKFAIQNNAMMFDILRNRMYSDPISSCVREIMCNARDTHRATGKPDLPVQVEINSIFKVKDFGSGISPSLMKDVFKNYGASTKRDDNTQTGGFGLGAKTPFAYTDSFSVITIVDGIKYNYVCYINETKEGAYTLLHSSETEEPNGTEIVVKIKNYQDERAFLFAITEVAKFWKEDVILNSKLFQGKIKYHSVFNNFCTLDGEAYYTNSKSIFAIIDGIRYKISNPNIKPDQVMWNFKKDIYIIFGNNDLSLAANREQLSYDIKTITKINSKLKESSEELISYLRDKINEQETYKEAMKFYISEIVNMFNGVSSSEFSYRGKKLFTSQYVQLQNNPVTHFYSRKNRSGSITYQKSYISSVSLDNKSEIYYNDWEDVSHDDLNSKSFSLFLNEDVKDVFVIHGNLMDLKKSMDPDDLGIECLSSVMQKPSKKKDAKARLNIYKLDDSKFSRVPYKSSKSDKNRKILVKLRDNKRQFEYLNNYYSIEYFPLKNDVSIYGISESIWEEFSDDIIDDFVRIEDYVDELFTKYEQDIIAHDALRSCNKPQFNILFYHSSDQLKSMLIFNEEYLETIDKIKDIKLDINESEEVGYAYKLARHFKIIYEKDLQEKVVEKVKEFNSRFEWIDENAIERSFLDKYPLIKHAGRVELSQVASYMNGQYLLNLRLAQD